MKKRSWVTDLVVSCRDLVEALLSLRALGGILLGIGFGIPWISLGLEVLDPKAPLDMDTSGLFSESFARWSWPERFGIWAHTPHPFGVLIQQAYLQGAAHLGINPELAWRILLVLCLLLLLCLALFWALFLRRKSRGGSFRFGTAVGFLILALPLSPSIRYAFTTLEEDAIGLTIFAGCMLAVGFFGSPVSVKGVCGYVVLFSIMWSWHLQYGVILSAASIVGGCAQIFRGASNHDNRVSRAGFLLLVVGLLPTALHTLLHIVGVVRYTSYTDDFPSIVVVLDGRASLIEYSAVFLQGATTALLGIPAALDVRIVATFISYTALFLLLVREAIRRRDDVEWFLWVSITALVWPYLYEPTSLERWTAATVALLFVVALLTSGGVEAPMPKKRLSEFNSDSNNDRRLSNNLVY